MNNSSLYLKYKKLYESLKDIIKKSEKRVVNEHPDSLFFDNINYFIKSYLISICTYLEAYLQDVAYQHVQRLNERISKASIPKNYVLWRLKKDIKIKDLHFEYFDIDISKKELSDQLSGNPYKTINLFRYLGIDIAKQEDFQRFKDLVNTVVNKRNNIIHHNDKAMDISFLDLLFFIDTFLVYMKAIDDSVNKTKTADISFSGVPKSRER